jgi:hypothetical protein
MSRFMSVVWTLQLCVLLGLTVVLSIWPMSVPSFLFKCTISEQPAMEAACSKPSSVDHCIDSGKYNCSDARPLSPYSWDAKYIIAAVRLLTPFIFALAMFTLHALLRADERARRRFAAVFTAFGAALCYQFRDDELLLRIMVVFTAFQAVYAAMHSREPRRLSGMADTRPPELWVLWVIQGLVFFAAAGIVWQFSIYQSLLALPTAELSHAARYGPLLDDIDQLAWPFYLAIGLFSFLGTSASRQWSWRSFCRIFSILYLVYFLVFLFIWDGTVFKPWTMLLWLPILGAGIIHGAYWFKTDIWFAEEVGEGPDGWLITDVAIGALLLFRTLLTRRRPHYSRGVAVRGRFEPIPTEENSVSFFEKAAPSPQPDADDSGQPRFEVVVRFSTNGPDDAGLAARGVALQLVNWRRERFDLMLSTGPFMGPENLVEFTLTHLAQSLGRPAQRWLMQHKPRFREAAVAELRRAPSCYTHLEYYSQTVRFWIANTGDRQLVRYRLMPQTSEPIEPWQGIERDEELADRERAKDEWRPPDYLKQVLKRRIESKSLKMRLEAQLHDPAKGAGVEWFSPSVDWSPVTHPWKKLGVIVLEKALPDSEAEALCFNPAITPASLGTPVSPHVLDPRSIADAERRVHRRVQDNRKWMTRLLGRPRLHGMPQDS